MQNLDFYAQNSVLYKKNIIFTSNNKIYKFHRSKKTLETIFSAEKTISHLIISNNLLIFKTNINSISDIFQLNLKTYELKQLTYFDNASSTPLAIINNELIYTTNEYNPHRISSTFKYNLKTHKIESLNLTKIHAFIKIGNDLILQKYQYGKLTWKNYQGGLRGIIYKNNKPLIKLSGQSLNPIYHNNRVYFIYNEGDTSSIVSCSIEGEDLQYHYKNNEYLILDMQNQDNEIIFSVIGNIFIYNIDTKKIDQILIANKKINIKEYQSLDNRYITSADIHQETISLAVRGNIFEKHLYSGGYNQLSNKLRFVKTGYIKEILFAFKDGNETELYIYKKKNNPTIFKLESQKIHHVNVKDKYIAYSNHKHELRLIDLEGNEQIIDKASEIISYFEISEDGKWIVYEYPQKERCNIKLYSIEEKIKHTMINDIFYNYHPSIDPLNRFIVFLSNRNLKIEHDSLKFDYHFKDQAEAYYIPLKDEFNLLEPWKEEKKEKINEIQKEYIKNLENKITKVKIKNTINKIFAINDNKLLILEGNNDKNNIITYNLKTLTQDLIQEDCQTIILSQDKQNMIFVVNDLLKYSKAGEKLDETGYKNQIIQINFESRTSIYEEIQNIFEELSWMIQEFYWDPKKASYLKNVLTKYKNHITRICTKTELHNILDQMQSEMQTSHAYLFERQSGSQKGTLCCDIEYNETTKQYIIKKILNNYADCEHPIYNYNLNIKEGDIIVKINNIKLDKHYTYQEALLNKKDQNVTIEIKQPSTNTVKIYNIQLSNSKNEKQLRYLNWIDNNIQYINKESDNQIGYIHVPDMSEEGFKQFFTHYLDTYKKESLIIDLRYNRGGHISSLLIEQLYKKKLGTDISRHHEIEPLPIQSSNNNYVLLINAYTASDGEIFTESFKQLKLGKIFGERTWGGVVGICPRNPLIDNLLTSQPEFNTNFFTINQNQIENYGATPDIEIEDIWNEECTVQNDKILNEAIKFCKETYLQKK